MADQTVIKHRLGPAALTAIVVASMIGAGVFTTSGFAIADLGTPERVFAAWILGGLLALLGAMSYGLIAQEILESGGEYVYLARNVHSLAGFLAGWISLLAGFSGAIAFAASAFEAYLVPSGAIPENAVAIAVVLVAAVLHGRVPRWGVAAQTLVVAVKLGTLLVFIAIGAWLAIKAPVSVNPVAASIPGLSMSAMAVSLVWIFLSYSGFNAAIYVAEEVGDPARLVPRAMLWGTLAVTLVYLGLNALIVFAVPAYVIAGSPNVAFVAAGFLGGNGFAELVRWIVLMALFTSVLSMVMTGPRVYAKMADDGLMPPVFRSGNGHARAVLLQAALAIAIILASNLRELLSYLGFTLSLSSAFAVASVFVSYRRSSVSDRPAWHWLVPLVYVCTVIGLATLGARQNPAEFAAALLTIASGCVMYLLARRLRVSGA